MIAVKKRNELAQSGWRQKEPLDTKEIQELVSEYVKAHTEPYLPQTIPTEKPNESKST